MLWLEIEGLHEHDINSDGIVDLCVAAVCLVLFALGWVQGM